MAVTLLNTFIKSTINGTSTALTIGTTNQAGDICVAFWVHTRATLTAVLSSSAGTAYTDLGATSNGNLTIEAGYRVLTSSETTVASCNTGSAQDSVVLMAAVIRNIASNPLIVDSNSTIGTSSNPNSPSETVYWPNSAVLTAAGQLTATAITAAPSGFTNLVSSSATDTRSCAGALAFKSTNPGLTDPSSFTGGVSAAWAAFTVTIGSTESSPMAMRRATYMDGVPRQVPPMIGY